MLPPGSATAVRAMGLSSDDLDAQFQTARALVDELVARLGLDPQKTQRKREAGFASWALQRGSAAVLITLVKGDRGEAVYLRVVSPVMTLPPPDRRAALFERLLELNAQGLVNAAFALVGEQVVLVSERPTQGLDAGELRQIVGHLSAVADTYDDRLVREFGGRRASDVGTVD